MVLYFIYIFFSAGVAYILTEAGVEDTDVIKVRHALCLD